MEINNLNEFTELNELIINSLNEYDETILKYENYITNEVNFNHKTYEIKLINNLEYNFELLGLFDNSNNIWIWGWAIYIDNKITGIVKDLLIYGLKIEPELNSRVEFSFIKSLLVNSRILIENDIELNINLAIIFRLIKNKCLFIFPYKHYLDDIKYLTYYYIVKKNLININV